MSKFSRFFLCMTYVTERDLKNILLTHSRSIRANCYIYHDKDDAEPHRHVVIRTYSSWSVSAIEKWFKGFVDSDGKSVNTFVQIANDLDAILTYLTHDDEDSKSQGKYRYNKSDIVDNGVFDIVQPKDSVDSSYDIINDILLNMSERDLVIRYGRDYVFHRSAYETCADHIRWQEGYGRAVTVARERRLSLTDLSDLDIKKFFKKEGN